MSFDYTKFKTPYFDIEVGDSAWNTRIKLPEYLLRAITKVEIMESFFTSENSGTTQIVLSFVEGFENTSGFISDLVFDGKQGISTLGEDGKKKASGAPRFLFQEKNLIKVTWGYLEDIEHSRSMMCYIIQAGTNFSETALPATTITCLPWSHNAGDQLSTLNGRPFGTQSITSKGGDSLVVFNDLKTDFLIRRIAIDLGMKTIISPNLHNDIIDKNKQKMWVSGQSFQQFMTRLAKASGCTYGIQLDPKTGKNTIIFIKKSDFEKRTVIADVNLLYWKAPGSILKNINLQANFGGLLGASKKGVDNEGKSTENVQIEEELLKDKNSGGKKATVYTKSSPLRVEQTSKTTGKTQNLIDTNPLGNYAVPSAAPLRDSVANGGTTGVSSISPAQDKQVLADKAKVEADDLSKLITLDFTTVGYTRLTPGIVDIGGIGLRYSGKYRIISVTHTIDNSGYVTKCTANSQSLGAGGVAVKDLPKADKDDKLVDEQLLETNVSATDPLAQLRKLQGIA